MTIQYIENNGQRQYAVIPVDIYTELLEKAEMLDDIKAFDLSLANDEEQIPSEIVNRLLDGENKLKVWREYRQMTQINLAKLANVSQPTIAQIETGQRTGTAEILKRLASSLNVDIDDIV
jgi:DNA-binding XRE family transcriptional regulator